MFSKFNAVYPQTQETPGSKIPGFLPKFREASALYLTHFLRTFSLSLPGIYVPIFIFGLAQKPAVLAGDFLNNIFWVLVYYFIYSIFVTLANIFLSNLLFQKLGFRVSILLSMLFLVLVVACLFELEENFSLIYLAPVLTALAVHFYWIPLLMSPKSQFWRQFRQRVGVPGSDRDPGRRVWAFGGRADLEFF
ncbi:MAG: hypothetical protein UW85_C0019G0004 [Parcubacteria group bacterium GW2011_GWA1_Parcubacteria_45_10]|nr:MAG: hypothetical protein UW85_C0019G0004 [Parcubacteria group bacterium GW2011_GWA1_Parcubacteria_45_10]